MSLGQSEAQVALYRIKTQLVKSISEYYTRYAMHAFLAPKTLDVQVIQIEY